MQNRFGLLVTDVIPIYMIIALDILIIICSSINCPIVIRSPTVLFSILREASSETYGPRVYFPSYKFLIYNLSFQSTILAIFYFPPKNIKNIYFIVYLSLSDLSFASNREGISLYRLSRWCKLFDCLCRYSVTCALFPTRLIPWFSN